MNPDFDTEIDQWVFVGQLFRAINVSPVGDYDFDGIDSREYQVLASEDLTNLTSKTLSSTYHTATTGSA